MQISKESDKQDVMGLNVDELYIRPERANELMKTAKGIHQTVYIYGATGFGKTSFAADFLSRKRYRYYSMATDVLPEEMWEASDEEKSPKVKSKERIVVVDDLHCLTKVDERERCYAILKRLAKDRNIWLILISRAPLPAWLKPLHIECIFVNIGESELSFTEKEKEKYLQKWQLELMRDTERYLKSSVGGASSFPAHCSDEAAGADSSQDTRQGQAEKSCRDRTKCDTGGRK